MKIINKLTWRHLWANKKRTVITLFGIIISVAMVTAVFTSVESLMNTMGEITASYDGAWHAKYNELKSKDVQTLAKQKNVKAIGLSMDLGEISSKADSNSSKSRTDVLACNPKSFYDIQYEARHRPPAGNRPGAAGDQELYHPQ